MFLRFSPWLMQIAEGERSRVQGKVGIAPLPVRTAW